MNIRELIEADGFDLKWKASTNGGEYACRCPFCGGTDRFLVWPEQGEHGRWYCRQCGRWGDAIQYLRDHRKMSFKESCAYVGKEINSFTPSLSGRKPPLNNWSPRQATPPGDLWQERARKLVEESERLLFSSYGFAQIMLGWLKERRGLTEETIKAYRLGLVPINRWDGHEQWGLEPILKNDGKPRKILIPRGLTIPFCQDGKIHRIRIRRPKIDLKSDDDNRYHTIRGSDSKPMILEPDREIQVVVESDLDAILVVQEAKGLVGSVSLGSAQKKPDKETATILHRSQLILVALDDDDAGAKQAWDWWLGHHFPQARRLPPIDGGKDPGDMWASGVNLREWIEAGIRYHSKKVAVPIVEEIERRPIPSKENGNAVMHETSPISSSTENIVEEEGYSGQITPERQQTCYECSYFRPAISSANPTQSWGYCEQKRKGRFGVARACETIV